MTTLTRMHEKIFIRTIRFFFERNMLRVAKGKRKNLFIEPLPPKVIGRTYITRDDNQKHIGFDICLSEFYTRNYPNLQMFKQIILHEISHCGRGCGNHRMIFRRTARRIGVQREHRGCNMNIMRYK